MPRRKDGSTCSPRGRASGFFSKKSRIGARLQQIARQNGQKHTAEAQGAEAKVSNLIMHIFFSVVIFLLLVFLC